MTGLIKPLLLLTVLLTPLIGVMGNFGYEQAKVLFFIVLTSLSGFLWLIYLLRKPKFKWSVISKAAGLFIVILFITSLMGNNPTQSILGTQPYFQGWILYAYLFLFFLLVSASKIKFDHWAYVLVGSSVIVSLLAIKDWVLLNIFNVQIPTYAGRVVSTFGQPNFYAGFLLLSLPFAYYLFKKGNQLMLYVILILITGIFVSYSRSTILLALVLFIFALLDNLKIKLRGFLIVSVVLLIASGVALKFSSGIIGNEFSKPLNTNNPDLTKESVEKRIYIWPQALKVVLEKPLSGYGLENIPQAFSDYFIKFKHPLFEENLNISPVLISFKDLNLDRTHSYTLDLLIFSGILGVGTWLILIATLSWKLTQKTKYPTIVGKSVLFVSLITYLIWIQFQNQSVVHLIYFWLLVGMIDEGSDYTPPER